MHGACCGVLALGVLWGAQAVRGDERAEAEERLGRSREAYSEVASAALEKAAERLDAEEEKERDRPTPDPSRLDAIKAEREAVRRGAVPKWIDDRSRRQITDARAKLDDALVRARSAALRNRDDRRAAEIDEELQQLRAAARPPDNRRRWVHDRGEYRLVEPGRWEEKSPDGRTYHYKEVARTPAYVELDPLDGNLALRVRLFGMRCDYAEKPNLRYTTFFVGGWAP